MSSLEGESDWNLWGVVTSPWVVIAVSFIICAITAYHIRRLFSFWKTSSLVLLASFLFALTIALVRPVGDYVLKGGTFLPGSSGDIIGMCVAYVVLVSASLGMIRYLYRLGGCSGGQANPDIRDPAGFTHALELFLVFMCFCLMHLATVILGALMRGLLSIF